MGNDNSLIGTFKPYLEEGSKTDPDNLIEVMRSIVHIAHSLDKWFPNYPTVTVTELNEVFQFYLSDTGKELKGTNLLDKPDPKTEVRLDDPSIYRNFVWNADNFESGKTII